MYSIEYVYINMKLLRKRYVEERQKMTDFVSIDDTELTIPDLTLDQLDIVINDFKQLFKESKWESALCQCITYLDFNCYRCDSCLFLAYFKTNPSNTLLILRRLRNLKVFNK